MPSGGSRPGAGRKPVGPRCYCGKHSLKRAVTLRLRCGVLNPPIDPGWQAYALQIFNETWERLAAHKPLGIKLGMFRHPFERDSANTGLCHHPGCGEPENHGIHH